MRLRALRQLSDAALTAFAEWFASAAGVWETTVVLLGGMTYYLYIGQLYKALFFLALMTVYSSVTQPVLAFVGRVAAQKAAEVLLRMASVEDRLVVLEEDHGRQLTEQSRTLAEHGKVLAAIARQVGVE